MDIQAPINSQIKPLINFILNKIMNLNENLKKISNNSI